ncbi:Nn.00g104240.m01.CDS01 [Neocucurbitaria sp. VM-36]
MVHQSAHQYRRKSSYTTAELFFALLIPAGLIRFALFVPCGLYWARTKNHNNVITNHIELHNGTYPMIIAAGESMAAKWGNIVFFWNFGVWIPSFWFSPPLNLPFAIMDTVITAYLSKATHYQASYIPQKIGSCNPDKNPNFHDMLRPAGANESFFEAAARLNSTASTPREMCESFREEWQYGIAISCFYALISLIQMVALFGGLMTINSKGNSSRTRLVAVSQSSYTIANKVPRGIIIVTYCLVYDMPRYIFRCFPQSLQNPIRYGRRQAIKAGLGAEQATETQMNELTTNVKNIKGVRRNGKYVGSHGEQTPLAEFLGIYDMLMLVTEHLHYIDVANLSRVSKSVRESVLPARDFDRRMKVFKIYTCNNPNKADCWTCKNQICSLCCHFYYIPQTTILHHVENCQPYCTICYNATILCKRPPPGAHLNNPFCACEPVTNPNFLLRYMNGPKYYADCQAALQQVARLVCIECSVYSDVELLKMREKRAKVELRRGLKVTGEEWTTCANFGCGRSLGTGPRWWICSGEEGCGRECTSTLHKAWGRGVKGERKGGEAVGEDAV